MIARQVAILDLGQPRRAARRSRVSAITAEDRLAVELHRVRRRSTGSSCLSGWADVVLARNVLGRQHADDARRRAHRDEVDRHDLGMRPVDRPR